MGTFPSHRVTQRYPASLYANGDKMSAFTELKRHNERLYPGDDDHIRLSQFIDLLGIVRPLRQGDYIEMGTYQGGTARWIWRLRRPGSTLLCFDTFDGFPQEDMDVERRFRPAHNWTRTSFKPTTMDEVRQNITVGDETDVDKLVLVQGRVPQTLALYDAYRFRFCHIDMDLYEPTQHAIRWLWPRVVHGGIVVFHDYAAPSMPGVKQAVDDFSERTGLVGLPMGDACGSLMFVKAMA